MKQLFHWKLKPREARLLIYFTVLLGVAAWKWIPRPWNPSLTFEAPHHTIYASATPQQTEDTARTLEILYVAYSNKFSGVTGFSREHPKLKVKLFKDRAEFRRINPGLGWAEAYYRSPYCRAYFSAEEINPYHWMLHEAVHQLNNEVAHLKLEKWLEEGLAEYFSTSRVNQTNLAPGRIDLNTYPVWWIEEIATSEDLQENIRNGSVIPLRSILTSRGGPSMSKHFNLYYLHWWTLTHFIFEDPKYRGRAVELALKGGGIKEFERCMAPVEKVEREWHAHVREIKKMISSNNLRFLKTGEILFNTNAVPAN